MPTSLYNFQYVPLTGRLPGKSFVSQTEQAINGLAQYVYENSTNYEAVKAIAQKAEEDSSSALEYSEQALDKAQTALETVGRAYIKTTSAVDLNDYFDSELLVILSTESTNLPASISGYLTVMSSDTHDYCMQVYIGVDGSVYKRTATISNNTPTFGAWSESPITMSSLQSVLNNYTTVSASNIGVNAQTDNSVAWGNAIGGGEIAEDEQRLITGGTIYPLSQNVAQNTSNIATNTADIVQNTGGISANSKRIGNIEKLLQGNLYDYQTDSDSKYVKTVPAGAMPYAGIEQIGGKTVVMNQLCSNGNFAGTTGWSIGIGSASLTATDNVLTVAVTSSSSMTRLGGAIAPTTTDHKFYIKGEFLFGNALPNDAIYMGVAGYYRIGGTVTSLNTWTKVSGIFTRGNVGSNSIIIDVPTANLVADDTFKMRNVVLIDLTQMFGAGNEPSTVAEFEAMFPADYYAYNDGELLSAGVTDVVSKDTNNATLQTYSIPASIQALEGYGWSAGTAYNYVDFERKVFVKCVDKIVLNGTQTVSIYNWIQRADGVGWIYPYSLTNNKFTGNASVVENIVSDVLEATSQSGLNSQNGIALSSGNLYGILIHHPDTSLSTASAVTTYLSNNPITVYYEMATPIETDISAYLTDDNLIQIEAGGTLTFPNQNGTDYQIPVPSEETYMIDLQEAINNG